MLTLHLPFCLVDRGFSLAWLLATQHAQPWSRGWLLRAGFALSGPEKRFARTLLTRKRNLWLFRCHQQRFCGDFVVIDMSAPQPALRRARVLELKSSGRLELEAGGLQLRNAPAAIAERIEAGQLTPDSPVQKIIGSGPEVLAWLGAAPP